MRGPAKLVRSRRGSASRSSPLPARVKRRRGGCARWLSGQALRPCLRGGLRDDAEARVRNDALRYAAILGAREFGAAVVVGAAAAFGEIDAVRFRALIERARALGASSLRLTPWRAFLITGLDQQRRRVARRHDRGARIDRRRGRSSAACRCLSRRARLRAWP